MNTDVMAALAAEQLQNEAIQSILDYDMPVPWSSVFLMLVGQESRNAASVTRSIVAGN